MARRKYNRPYLVAMTPARIQHPGNPKWVKGCQLALAGELRADQNARRLAGLIKVWKVKAKQHKRREKGGKAYMKAESKTNSQAAHRVAHHHCP